MIRVETAEDARQFADLMRPPGLAGSGRLRYAAAMHFYVRGMIGAEALEVFRACALIDGEDPRATLDRLGLVAEVFGPAAADQPAGGTG